MNVFEQIQNKMKEQQKPSYLRAGDLETVVVLLNHLSNGQITAPDVTKLEGCNVIAVLSFGTYALFSINPNNETPPHRNVKCYSHENDLHTDRDVVEVFNFIQTSCVAWVQI